MTTALKEDSKPTAVAVAYLTKRDARELYIALKDITFEGLPDDKVFPALVLISGITKIVDMVDKQLEAIQNKEPEVLKLSKDDIAKLKDDDEQAAYAIAKRDWDIARTAAYNTLLNEETTIVADETKLLTKEQLETFLKTHKKKIDMKTSVVLFNHLVK